MKSERLTPAIWAALPCEIRPTSYHLTAAASRISVAKLSGVLLSAENTSSGNSIVSCTDIFTTLSCSAMPIAGTWAKIGDSGAFHPNGSTNYYYLSQLYHYFAGTISHSLVMMTGYLDQFLVSTALPAARPVTDELPAGPAFPQTDRNRGHCVKEHDRLRRKTLQSNNRPSCGPSVLCCGDSDSFEQQ